MSSPSPSGGNPFEHMLGDLLRILNQAGPVQWDLARQLAASVASEGESEPNIDPLERIRLEQLAHIAQLHVNEATGLGSSVPTSISITPLSRSEWALKTLEAWQPLLDSLSRSITPAQFPQIDASADLDSEEGLSNLLNSLGKVMGPAILGLQFGSSVGHLARRAIGMYDFPIPRQGLDELYLVPANLIAFAQDWSLQLDDVRMWVCVNELTHHALLRLPAVTEKLGGLLASYVKGYRGDNTGLEERLAGIDPNDLGALQAALGDPAGLVREQESPEQSETRERLEAVVTALEGYVDYVSDTVGKRLIGSFGPLTEALRRRRVERGSGERFMERLFGLELSQSQFDRGAAFVAGVVGRAGPEALLSLWKSAESIPTPAEIQAPGLWLARVNIESSTDFGKSNGDEDQKPD